MKSLVGFAACVVATTALLLNCSDSANPAPAPVLPDGALPPIADAAVDSEAAPAGDTAVAGVTISGRVVSYQAGIANVKVTVQGKQTTTDMRGNFSLAGIAVPYTVSAVLESDQTVGIPLNGRAVTTYVGLRTLAPVLNVTAKGGLSVMAVAGTLAVDNSVVRQAGAVLDVLATGTLTSGIDTIKDPARAFSVPTYFPADVQQTTVNYFAYS